MIVAGPAAATVTLDLGTNNGTLDPADAATALAADVQGAGPIDVEISGSGTIQLSSTLDITGDVTISVANGSTVTLDGTNITGSGSSTDSAVYAAPDSTVSISGLSIVDATVGVYAYAATVTLVDDNVDDNGRVQAYASHGSTLTVEGGTFSGGVGGGTATSYGISVGHSSTATIEGGAVIEGNASVGVYDYLGSSVTISGAVIESNGGGGKNAGVFAYDSTLHVYDGTSIEANLGYGIDAGPASSGVLGSAPATTYLVVTDSHITQNPRGGIHDALPGTIDVTSSYIENNGRSGSTVVTQNGGGIFAASAPVTITGTTISDNTAYNNGAGVYTNGYAEVQVTSSTISDNQAVRGSGGGLNVRTGDLEITSSTISGNTASSWNGGGIYAHSGRSGSTMRISESTISGNVAEMGGGVNVTFESGSGAAATFESDTIVDNASTANTGAGVSDYARYGFGAALTVENSILAGNVTGYVAGTPPTVTGTSDLSDTAGTAVVAYSLVQNPDSGSYDPASATGDIFGQDPDLSMPVNGAMAPYASSPVIDQGKAYGDTTDQVGNPRTVDLTQVNAAGGDGTDMGAVELQPSTVDQGVTSTALQTSAATATSGGSVTLTATVTPAAAGSVEFFDGTTSLGTSATSGGVATLTTTALSVGTDSVTATFTSTGGDYVSSTSDAVTVTVAAAPPIGVIPLPSPSPSTSPSGSPSPSGSTSPSTPPKPSPKPVTVVSGSNTSHSSGNLDAISLRVKGAAKGTSFVIRSGGKVVGHGTVGANGKISIRLKDKTPKRSTTYGVYVKGHKIDRITVG